jgi:hypothetical protein
MDEWYVNLRCKRCGRFAGTVIKGKAGDKKTVGCKVCRLHTDITLKDWQFIEIPEMEINFGYYYFYNI